MPPDSDDPNKTAASATTEARDVDDDRPRSRWERPMPPMGKVRRGPRQRGLRGGGRQRGPHPGRRGPADSPPPRDAPEGDAPPRRVVVDERRRIQPGQRLTRGGVIRVTPSYYLTQGFAQAEERGRKVAVWNGIVGEPSDVLVQHVGKNRIRARFLAPASGSAPHPARRAPPCEKYDQCGSCPLMHLDDAGQRTARRYILRRALEGVGLEDLTPDTLFHVEGEELGYRHAAKLVVGRSDRGQIRVGAYRRGSHDIVSIPDCPVVTDGVRKAMRVTAHAILDLELGPWDPEGRDGPMRHVVLRQSRTTGEILATIIAGWHDRAFTELANRMTSIEASIVGVHLHMNSKRSNAIFDFGEEGEGPGFKKLTGARSIYEDHHGLRMEIGPGDFFQTNPAVGGKLVSDALEWLEPWRDRPVVDLYCGVGAFSLPLAQAHGFALGVEAVPGAIRRADANARRNHVGAEFVAGKVDDIFMKQAERLRGRGAVVVADPARRGLEEGVIEAITSIEPAAFLLVSCNPSALARDLKAALELGWQVERVAAYEMFPQTVHLEAMVLLVPSTPPVPTNRAPRRTVVR